MWRTRRKLLSHATDFCPKDMGTSAKKTSPGQIGTHSRSLGLEVQYAGLSGRVQVSKACSVLSTFVYAVDSPGQKHSQTESKPSSSLLHNPKSVQINPSVKFLKPDHLNLTHIRGAAPLLLGPQTVIISNVLQSVSEFPTEANRAMEI